MHLLVVTVAGKLIPVDIDQDSTIQQLKAKIKNREQLVTGLVSMRLFYEGNLVKDANTIRECGIQNDATLHLLLGKGEAVPRKEKPRPVEKSSWGFVDKDRKYAVLIREGWLYWGTERRENEEVQRLPEVVKVKDFLAPSTPGRRELWGLELVVKEPWGALRHWRLLCRQQGPLSSSRVPPDLARVRTLGRPPASPVSSDASSTPPPSPSEALLRAIPVNAEELNLWAAYRWGSKEEHDIGSGEWEVEGKQVLLGREGTVEVDGREVKKVRAGRMGDVLNIKFRDAGMDYEIREFRRSTVAVCREGSNSELRRSPLRQQTDHSHPHLRFLPARSLRQPPPDAISASGHTPRPPRATPPPPRARQVLALGGRLKGKDSVKSTKLPAVSQRAIAPACEARFDSELDPAPGIPDIYAHTDAILRRWASLPNQSGAAVRKLRRQLKRHPVPPPMVRAGPRSHTCDPPPGSCIDGTVTVRPGLRREL